MSIDTSWQIGQLLEEICIELDFNILNNECFTYVGTQGRNVDHQYNVKTAIDVTLSKNIISSNSKRVDDICKLKTDHLPIHIHFHEELRNSVKLKWELEKSYWDLFRNTIEAKLEVWANSAANMQV